jgi:hypothetical protein
MAVENIPSAFLELVTARSDSTASFRSKPVSRERGDNCGGLAPEVTL